MIFDLFSVVQKIKDHDLRSHFNDLFHLCIRAKTLELLLDTRHLEQKAKPHLAQPFSRFRSEKDLAQLVHDMILKVNSTAADYVTDSIEGLTITVVYEVRLV